MHKGFSTKKISGLAVLASISIVLVLTIHFPLIPSPIPLEYDPADIPIFLGTFMYGPFAGIILTAVVCVLQGTTVSAASGPYGILMHFFATGSYVLVAGLIYKMRRTYKGAIHAIISGSIVSVGTMVLWNLLITPLYLGVPRAVVAGLIPTAILPFNAIKISINSIATLLLYKHTKKFFNYILDEKDRAKEKNGQDKIATLQDTKSSLVLLETDKNCRVEKSLSDKED